MPTKEEIQKRYQEILAEKASSSSTPSTTAPSKEQIQARYQEILAQRQAPAPVEAPAEAPKKNVFRKVADFFTSSEQGLGKTFGDALATRSQDYKQAQESQVALDDMNMKLGEAIAEGKKLGKDTSRMERLYQENTGRVFRPEEIAPSLEKSVKQVAGEALGTVADIASFGTYGNAVKGARSGSLITKAEKASNLAKIPKASSATNAFVRGATKEAKVAAPLGALYGASASLSEDKSVGEVAKDAVVGGAVGGLFGAVLGGLQTRKAFLAPEKAQILQQKAAQQYKKGLAVTKEKYKEQADKIIPDLLANKKWGTRKKLLNDALESKALTDKQYEQLGELQGVAEVDGILGMIDKEISKLKTPNGKVIFTESGKYKALNSLKEDIEDYVVKTAVSENGGPVAVQQQLRELASQYGDTLYNTRKSLQTVGDSQKLSQVQKVDGAIRELLAKENPAYNDINKVYTLNARLTEILNSTIERESGGPGIKKIAEYVIAASGTVAALMSGSTRMIQGLAGTLSVVGLVKLLESTWWNTMRAVQKQKVAERLLNLEPSKLQEVLIISGRQGAKYLQEIGIIDKSQ